MIGQHGLYFLQKVRQPVISQSVRWDTASMECHAFLFCGKPGRRGPTQLAMENSTIVTLGSILDSQLSWESSKFQLARWGHEVMPNLRLVDLGGGFVLLLVTSVKGSQLLALWLILEFVKSRDITGIKTNSRRWFTQYKQELSKTDILPILAYILTTCCSATAHY